METDVVHQNDSVDDVHSELKFWIEEAHWLQSLRISFGSGNTYPITRAFLKSGRVEDDAVVLSLFNQYEAMQGADLTSYLASVPISGFIFTTKIDGKSVHPIKFRAYLRRDGSLMFSSEQRACTVPPIVYDVNVLDQLGFSVLGSAYGDLLRLQLQRLHVWPESFVDMLGLLDIQFRTLFSIFDDSTLFSELARKNLKMTSGFLGVNSDHANLASQILESVDPNVESSQYPLLRRFLASEGWHAPWSGEGLSEILGHSSAIVPLSNLQRQVVAASVTLADAELLRALGSNSYSMIACVDSIASSLRIRTCVSIPPPPLIVEIVQNGSSQLVPSLDTQSLRTLIQSQRDRYYNDVWLSPWLSEVSDVLKTSIDSLYVARSLLMRRIVEMVSEIHREESDLSRVESTFYEFVSFSGQHPIGSPEFVSSVRNALSHRTRDAQEAIAELEHLPVRLRRSRALVEKQTRIDEDAFLSASLVSLESEFCTLETNTTNDPELSDLNLAISIVEHSLCDIAGSSVRRVRHVIDIREFAQLCSSLKERFSASIVLSDLSLDLVEAGSLVAYLDGLVAELMYRRSERELRNTRLLDTARSDYYRCVDDAKSAVIVARRERREREINDSDTVSLAVSSAFAERDQCIRLENVFSSACDALQELRVWRNENEFVSFDDMRSSLDTTLRFDADRLCSLYWRSFFMETSLNIAPGSSICSLLGILALDIPVIKMSVGQALAYSLSTEALRSNEPCFDLLIFRSAELIEAVEGIALLNSTKSVVVSGNPVDKMSLTGYSFLSKAQRNDRFSSDGFASLEFSSVDEFS